MALVRGDAKTGLLDRVAEGVDSVASKFKDAAADIEAQIAEVQQKLADLKIQAEAGFEVSAQTDRALEDLDFLQKQLAALQASGISAANAIRAKFAEAFRASENASMAALAALRAQSLSSSGLPTVTRYGGNPNQITLPGNGAPTVQTNVNGSGVNVTKYSSDTAENTKDTAGYAHDTSDNIQRLDQNTQGYFRSLTDAMGRYSSNEVNAIGGLSDSFAAAQYNALDAITAQMVQAGLNTGSISQPSSMFGDQWDPQHGSHVGPILNLGRAPHWVQPSYSDDGSRDTQVTVQQPGNSYTMNYYGAPGESIETT
ncbi:MAG: hypothetical protein E5X96_02090, partial [Mesorhizobium sp.]